MEKLYLCDSTPEYSETYSRMNYRFSPNLAEARRFREYGASRHRDCLNLGVCFWPGTSQEVWVRGFNAEKLSNDEFVCAKELRAI
jgi:hypothetical protein